MANHYRNNGWTPAKRNEGNIEGGAMNRKRRRAIAKQQKKDGN